MVLLFSGMRKLCADVLQRLLCSVVIYNIVLSVLWCIWVLFVHYDIRETGEIVRSLCRRYVDLNDRD